MKTISQKSAIKILETYNEREDNNDHCGNFILLSKIYGDEKCRRVCIENREKRDKQGHADTFLWGQAYLATQGFYQKLVKDATVKISASAQREVKMFTSEHVNKNMEPIDVPAIYSGKHEDCIGFCEMFLGYKFVADESLFGGYYAHFDGTCLIIM